MKILKSISSLVMAFAAAVLGLTVFAAEAAYDVSKENVIIYNTAQDSIIITGTTSNNTIKIGGGTYNITLSDVNIDVSAQNNRPAFEIESDSIVNLTLLGENTLKSGNNCAGLQLDTSNKGDAAVIIDGNGTLYAHGGISGAGIGGKSMSRNGSVTINGGTIFAYGGGTSNNGAAGIGGGSNGSSYKATSGGTITINGGNISAYGKAGGSGIGGGTHGDGGSITIGKNAVIAEALGADGGAGIGSGIGSSKGNDKGPGHVNGGTITIQDNCVIKNAASNWNGAGIGGGMYSDSGDIIINGGTIELAQGGNGTEGSYHHGAAGIGSGYQGHSTITINGGVIKQAIGSFSGAGIGSGPVANADKRPKKSLRTSTVININGGTIELAKGGIYGGAGIGAGFATDNCEINITGGKINAFGFESSEDEKAGGAGIGSSTCTINKYNYKTNVAVNISGGTVYAKGGWGASGIGSGAVNKTADEISISGGTKLTAFADGTKFAIDTEKGAVVRNNISDKILQGTYTLPYRGMNTSVILDNETVKSITLPEGYRSFAVDVDKTGNYMIKVGDKVFASKPSEATESDVQGSENVYKFNVGTEKLSDNNFLYPIALELVSDSEATVPVEVKNPYELSNNYAYIFGRTDNEMMPDEPILCGEACSVLYRLLKQNNRLGGFVFDEKSEPIFEGTDGRWDRSAVEYASYVGVFSADENRLDPSVPITRKEAFKLIVIELGFTDRTDLSYEQYAKILVDRNYVEGYPDGSLGLDLNISRAEFCKIYNLIIRRDNAKLETADGTPVTSETYGFGDIDLDKKGNSHWARDIILRATSAYDDNGFVDIAKRGVRNELDDYNE